MPPRGRPRENPAPANPLVNNPEYEEEVDPLYKIEKRFRERQPPIFNGLGEPREAEEWVRTLDKLFDHMRCPDAARVSCALLQLTGEADYWWESVRRTMTPEEWDNFTWEEFKTKFTEKFVPRSYRHKKEYEFLTLKQGSKSVTEYDRAFNQLSRYAPHLVDTDEKKADRFKRGLIPQISMTLVGLGPLSYAEVLNRALDIEAVMPQDFKKTASNMGSSSDNKRKWEGQQGSSNTKGKKPWQAPQQKQWKQSGQSNPQPQKAACQNCGKTHQGKCRFGTQECYTCGQMGHFSKECPYKRQQLVPQQGQPIPAPPIQAVRPQARQPQQNVPPPNQNRTRPPQQ